MSTATTKDIGTEIKKAVDEMRTLRDEARVKLHLASMDARTAWEGLQPKIEQAERDASNASIAVLTQIETTAKKLREFVASL